jgi:hypothetical protein
MKALPPARPQLQLAIYQDRSLVVSDPDARKEAVRALAEILLIAADAAEVHDPAALLEADHETP